jgi:hypothetical protein
MAHPLPKESAASFQFPVSAVAKKQGYADSEQVFQSRKPD